VTRPLADSVETSRLVLSQRRDVPPTKSTEAFVWHCVQIFGLDMD
jgi:hypothetical protein